MATIRPTECNLIFGSERQIGFGVECKPCEPSTNMMWLKEIESFDDGKFRTTEAKRTNLGRRDNKTRVKVTDSGSSWSFTMQITCDSLGLFLGMFFNDLTTVPLTAPTFRHEFCVDGSFCPPTMTIGIVTPCSSRRITGAVVSSLSWSFAEGADPTITVSGEGAFPEDDPTLLPVVLDEETYEQKDICVLCADDITTIQQDMSDNAGTSEDPYETKLCVQDLTIEFTNTINTRACLGDFDDCANKKRYWGEFDATGSFTKCLECDDEWEALYNQDDCDEQQTKALRLVLLGNCKRLSDGTRPFVFLDFYALQVSGISEDAPLDDVITQTVDFEYTVDADTDESIKATIKNEQDGSAYLPLNCE